MDGEREKKVTEEASGSGQQLFSPEDSHKAKRPRTSNMPVTHYATGHKTRSPVETMPGKRLFSKGRFDTGWSEEVQSAELSSRGASPVTLIDVQPNMTLLKPLSEMGDSPKESVFTIITEQRDTTAEVSVMVPSPQLIRRTVSVAVGAVTPHVDDIVKGAAESTDPAVTSSEAGIGAVTSADLGQWRTCFIIIII